MQQLKFSNVCVNWILDILITKMHALIHLRQWYISSTGTEQLRPKLELEVSYFKDLKSSINDQKMLGMNTVRDEHSFIHLREKVLIAQTPYKHIDFTNSILIILTFMSLNFYIVARIRLWYFRSILILTGPCRINNN